MKIIGVKKFTSKEGKAYCIVSVVREYSEQEKAFSSVCEGMTVDNVWLPANCVDKVTVKDIGKKLVLEGTYVNRKMYISDVSVA